MPDLLSVLGASELFSDLLEQVTSSQAGPYRLNLSRAARLPVVSALRQATDRGILLITGRADQALHYMEELNYWLPETPRQLFPEPNPLFYEQASWGITNRNERLRTITQFALQHSPTFRKNRPMPLVIAPVRAMMTRLMPRREFIRLSRLLKLNQRTPPTGLGRELFDLGYQPVNVVTGPGEYSARGGILDYWSPAEGLPVRLEFFGDEIDTLRVFEPASQRTIKQIEESLVTPAREVLPLHARGIVDDLDKLDEFDIPRVYREPSSLLDYLPANTLVLLDDQDYLQGIADEIEEQAMRMRSEAVKEGVLDEGYPIPYQSWSEIADSLARHEVIELSTKSEQVDNPIGERFRSGLRFGGRIKPFLDEVEQLLREGDQVFVVSRQVTRLQEIWQDHARLKDIDLTPTFADGILREGWIYELDEGGHIHLFTDGEVFGWERVRSRAKPRPRSDAPEMHFEDLRIGDWVVHVDYGVGQYAGLVKRVLDSAEREFLLIDYADGDQLYVPIHQADRLSRYIGPGGEAPKATRLGTTEWLQSKQRVKEAVAEVARDLLELYSKRQMASGFQFQPDSPWQREMEESFPYVETPDQVTAIAAVKRDMESPKPMDRLICGDVGYGKTEVAIRAAFKAVMNGKQVAVLVPTTVLAQQHFDTFRERVAPFPVEIEMLSRFRSPKEQDAIIKRIAKGEVDIVIGTHRLIQNDVIFKDLGLLIIDEEQRFGVAHKEHFKKMRTEVDVLTMTATPIPRTLYMAVTGVRDISNINTAPEERLPVITHIGPYDQKLVRYAILREMERGGQVFMVHNRVQTIHGMQQHLSQLVPDARIGVAHGQMPEQELSRVMQRFTQGELDVLLCTSIIESGLDIPNANTLIVDRGDTFGLAQLYQLRGRVGRGAQRAYAYFFRHRKRTPTPEGLERLETIAENTQLGAGYSIAMRDLEMRGAGDMLGTRQHGYIAAVGFHLYTRMLATAVREARAGRQLDPVEQAAIEIRGISTPVAVELPLAVAIPTDYVPDQHLRLGLYRRMALLTTEADLNAMRAELVDRFGPIPQQLENFLYQIRVKQLADQLGLVSVSMEGAQIVLRYPPLPEGVQNRNLPYVSKEIRAGRNAYWVVADELTWQQDLMGVLNTLVEQLDSVPAAADPVAMKRQG